MTSDSALLPVGQAEAAAPDDALLMEVLASQYRLSAVAVADRLGVFAALAEQPSAAAALAAARELHPHGTAVLLDALAAQGLLTVYGGAYHPTASARAFLLPGTARYWGPMLGLGWDERCTAVRTLVTEGTAYGYRGKGIWDTHNRSRHHGELFARAMHAHSAGPAAALAASLELGDCTSLLEIGGGVGTYSLALAGRNPRLTAQVLDLPVVERQAVRLIEDSGLTGRVRLRAGDMFGETWPGDQDLVLFADVLSDWDDEGCRALLGRARKALAPDGRLLIHQVLLDDSRHGSDSAAGYSLALAVMTGGRLRTLPELAALLAESGFGECAATPAYGHYSLITARPD
ncbi:hypothetical protein JGS22_005350 [Streptomyces sp. P38-E01]|uniref:O-methyltransferase n=1 Tax=Streptomyces tardus TaxID=2780544 RepID=A0A949JBN1_9ACTN|nr:methyltransferase [Streptomyces tardus]MBU7597077.1 hypothetical protein [Streptomyces tardus]